MMIRTDVKMIPRTLCLVLALSGATAACGSRQPCPGMTALDAYRAELGTDIQEYDESLQECVDAFEACAREGDLEPAEQAGLAYCRAAQTFQEHDWMAAQELLDEALEVYPTEVLLHHLKTHIAVNTNDVDGAIESALKEVALDPRWKWGWLDLTMAYMEAEQFEKAEETLGKYIEMDPESAMAHSMLGLLQMQLGYMGDIWLANLVKATKLAPEDPTYLLDLYEVLSQVASVFPGKEFTQQELLDETEQRIIDMMPGNVELLMEMARRRYSMEQYQRARELVMEAMQYEPDNVMVLEGLLIICEKTETCADEEAVMAQAHKLPQAEALHLISLYADLLRMQDQLVMAGQWAEKALELDDQQAEMHIILAAAQSERCQMADALDSAKKASDLAPEDIYILLREGAILAQADELDGAMENAEKIVQLEPGNGWGYALKSYVYYEQGQWEKSLELMDRALELMPDFIHFQVDRADTLFFLGRMDEAHAVIEEACQGEDEPTCKSLMGTLTAAQGDPEAGLALIDEALTLDPDNANMMVYKAWVLGQLAGQGKAEKQEARDVFMQAMQMRPALATKPWVLELKSQIPGMKKTKLEMGPMSPCP